MLVFSDGVCTGSVAQRHASYNSFELEQSCKIRIIYSVKTADSTAVVRQFGQFLSLVEAGQSIRITKHGRAVARLVPDHDFMSGKEAAALFRTHKADKLDRAAADAIADQIAQLDREADHALAH